MPAKLLPHRVESRAKQATNTLINIGVLLNKKILKAGLRIKYYDPKSGLLVVKTVLKDKRIQYEICKVQSEELTDDLHYEQVPKLLHIITTKTDIFIEHYIPGEWENRLTKLAEERLHGEGPSPKIQRPSRAVKG